MDKFIDDEPTALATDSGKDFVVSGDDAVRFLEHMKEVEENVEKRRNKVPTKAELEEQNRINKILLGVAEARVKELKDEIKEVEDKIKEFN